MLAGFSAQLLPASPLPAGTCATIREEDPSLALPLTLRRVFTRLPAYLQGRTGAKRSHHLYERLAHYLALARDSSPGHRLAEPAQRLALALQEEFSTKYGLRDALRRAGVLSVEAAGWKKTTNGGQA